MINGTRKVSKTDLLIHKGELNQTTVDLQSFFFFLSYLPFSLEAHPGWNKTAMTVPNSFIKSISTCSPECFGRLLSKARHRINLWLSTAAVDACYWLGRERNQQNPSRTKWVESVEAGRWRLTEGKVRSQPQTLRNTVDVSLLSFLSV